MLKSNMEQLNLSHNFNHERQKHHYVIKLNEHVSKGTEQLFLASLVFNKSAQVQARLVLFNPSGVTHISFGPVVHCGG